MTPTAAEQELKGTVSSDKNEILFSRFAINYNNEPQIFRKGTIIYRDYSQVQPSPDQEKIAAEVASPSQKLPKPGSRSQVEKERKRRSKAILATEHVDFIGNAFWEVRPWLLSPEGGGQSQE
jgi:tRNA(His) guanylyltransferase